MKEHYVSYDCAVKLKELGFDWECNHFYYNMTKKFCDWSTYSADNYNTRKEKFSAPRLDQAAAWLREVKGIIVFVSPEFYNGDELEEVRWYFYAQPLQGLRSQLGGKFGRYYSDYELALSAGIDAALELLTNKQTDK